MRDIVHHAAAICDVAPNEMLAPGASGGVRTAKRLAAYVLREHGFSYREIGLALGGRDHTTIVSTYKAARRCYASDAEFRNHADALLSGARVMVAADIGINLTVFRRRWKPRPAPKDIPPIPYGAPLWGTLAKRYEEVTQPIWRSHARDGSHHLASRVNALHARAAR